MPDMAGGSQQLLCNDGRQPAANCCSPFLSLLVLLFTSDGHAPRAVQTQQVAPSPPAAEASA